MALTELNLDFLAIITQFSLNLFLVVGLGIYLLCSYSWDSNSEQEEEAAKQFHQMRASLNRKRPDQTENSVHESLLPRDQSSLMSGMMGTQLFDLTAIAPNATNIQGINANTRQLQRRFMQDSINNSANVRDNDNDNDDDDNYRSAVDDEGRSEEDDGDEDDYFSISKPKSWCECIGMMLSQNEDRLLMIQNPDGLLYLTFLKQSGLLFFILSIISLVSMSILNQFDASAQSDQTLVRPDQSWNFSRLDSLTLANYLAYDKTGWVGIGLMCGYTLLAYFLLFSFSAKMSDFEFYSSNAFIDRFVANHSLIITGVSTEMSTDQVSRKVKKVFDYRFRGEDTKLVSCCAFRKTENVQKHWRKVKTYRAKQAEFEQESFASGEAKFISVGSGFTCNRRQVEGSKFYGEKLAKALEDWKRTKASYERENQGVVILVFKTKSCAEQVYEELVKMLGSQRIIQQKNEFFKELKFHQWKVFPAVPSEDIVWQNVDNLMNRSSWGSFLGYISPILVSSLAIFTILSLESICLHYLPYASTLLLYVSTSVLVWIAFYATPYLVFNSVQNEKLAQKSHKETSYMRRLLVIEILNVFVIPLVFNVFLVLFCPDGYRGRHQASIMHLDGQVAAFIDIIAFVEEVLLRFLLQVIMAVIFLQWRSDSRTILKTFLSSLLVTGRNKLKHYLYDLGLRNVLAVTMFTMGLCCSVLIPLAMPICTILFFFSYCIDKYNLFFVYPIDFDSQIMNRKILIKTTLSAIILFQAITITVLSSVVDQTTTIYLISFLVCQLLLSLIVLEFIRSPWKGAVLTIEEAEEELKNRLFEEEDIGAYDFAQESRQDNLGETTLIGLKKQEVITADEKIMALKTNYEDPFVDLVKTLHQESLAAADDEANGADQSYSAPNVAQTPAQIVTAVAGEPKEKEWLTTPLESIPERAPYVLPDPTTENP